MNSELDGEQQTLTSSVLPKAMLQSLCETRFVGRIKRGECHQTRRSDDGLVGGGDGGSSSVVGSYEDSWGLYEIAAKEKHPHNQAGVLLFGLYFGAGDGI